MDTDHARDKNAPETQFKKPMLVGKIGKFPKRLLQAPEKLPEENTENIVSSESDETELPPAPTAKPEDEVKPSGPSYTPPPWSTSPQTKSSDYVLEVLKNGKIIETVNLMSKPYWVFGRLATCDLCMAHPTISRWHAVLQYGSNADNSGFYIYDLESTHGTFLNKNRLKPRSFVRVHVGHMLKLGCSTRTYILNGPDDDAEEESPLSVTELKMKREEELRQRELQKQEAEAKRKRKEESGIDWGMGEDAEDEPDLNENPFAQTNNEDLYLDNPKKALRGFFEREGLELEYDCTEQGIGQFLCKVELPIDDEVGRPVFAEVVHKGKKKEAVAQCALEACRILDRHGLLRQATHESRKRKPKNWEENDYYDSDDDTFLDRTGAIEKKREMRMKSKQPQKAETYETLIEKERAMKEKINRLEAELRTCQAKLESQSSSSASDVDSLDSFMMELKHSKPNKQGANKIKAEIERLKQEHAHIIKLVNIAKPASLPPLEADYSGATTKEPNKKKLPLFGKRKKIKVQLPQRVESNVGMEGQADVEDDEEEEGDDELKHEKEKEMTSLNIKDAKHDDKTESAAKDNEDIKGEAEAGRELERRRKRNQKRIQQKQERAEMQKQQGYVEDARKEDYNMWVPPGNQTGDGRTSLNDKYGY